ncbi:Fic family protein [Vulgatibacter sp.]|uniref:Fic family protein n=1 Tax=Vulgatibacter sp. TaxID=1971226 RepID=UPI0035693D41
MLYLSLFFKKHRSTYYDLLQRVRNEGDWESWVRFFLQGVLETSDQAVATARRIVEMFAAHRRTLERHGRAAGSVLRLQEALQRRPVVTIAAAAEATSLSVPAVTQALEKMQSDRLVTEITGRKRDKVFVYTPYVALLGEGAEPLAASPG